MDPFGKALAGLTRAVFAHLGADAVFTPGPASPGGPAGPAEPCLVILRAPDALAAIDQLHAVALDAVIETPVAGLTRRPAPGDLFTIGAGTPAARIFACVDRARRREDDGEVWTVDVEERTP